MRHRIKWLGKPVNSPWALNACFVLVGKPLLPQHPNL